MKLIKYIVIVMITMLCMSSCKTTEKFSLRSTQNLEVYRPDSKTVFANLERGIPQKVKVKSTEYLGFVVAHDPINGLDVPIGLNVHRGNQNAKKALKICYTTCALGLGGGIGAAFGESLILPIVCLGIGITSIPAILVSEARNQQLAYDYEFEYDKTQTIDISGLSPTLIHPNAPKENPLTVKTSRRAKASSAETVSATTSGSKARKSRKNLSAIVEGTYRGSGKLLLNKAVDETYSDIILIIEQIDKTHVSVRIVESGEDFFETPLQYEVKDNGRKGYVLTLNGLPKCNLLITKNGTATFTHNAVNIDNVIYTLIIDAKK